jgi:uncharacterized protein (DUF2062 family)
MKTRIRNYWQKIKAVVMREVRTNASPFRSALSLSLGILVGFSPFYGLHLFIIIPVMFIFRLNRPLALLSVNSTILPVVPLWVAAGIYTGKLVIPLDLVRHVVEVCRTIAPGDSFDRTANGLISLSRHILPSGIFERMSADPENGIVVGFVHWALGSCVLAVVSALVTFVITYPFFVRLAARRKKLESTR